MHQTAVPLHIAAAMGVGWLAVMLFLLVAPQNRPVATFVLVLGGVEAATPDPALEPLARSWSDMQDLTFGISSVFVCVALAPFYWLLTRPRVLPLSLPVRGLVAVIPVLIGSLGLCMLIRELRPPGSGA